MQVTVVKREDDDIFVEGNDFLVEGNAHCFGWVREGKGQLGLTVRKLMKPSQELRMLSSVTIFRQQRLS